MPLSSVVGAQSIVKPGVCTSSTRPASPYDGQVIYETDTDRTLVWNGTGWVFLSTSRANPVGLDLVKTQTIGTAVSSITVSNAFNANYDSYKIMVTGGVGSTNGNFKFVLGSTTTGYYAVMPRVIYSTGAQSILWNNNEIEWSIFATFSTSGISFNAELTNPFLPTNTFFVSHCARADAGSTAWTGNGYLNSNISYTDFTLTTSTGTVTGGTISVYGYTK